jgi:hypothetical protein
LYGASAEVFFLPVSNTSSLPFNLYFLPLTLRFCLF